MHLRTGIAVLLAVAVCAGCASSSSSKGGGDTATTRPGAAYDAATARDGGTVTVGLSAETDGWNPVASQWSAQGYAIGGAVFDPLITGGADGKAHPYLAESVTPDATYANWTIKLRPNIKFHDGEALNADAVILQFSKVKQSLLVGQLFGPMTGTTKVDDLTVLVHLNQPWVAFPEALASQGGYIAAPKQLNASQEEAANHPIGTGPYEYSEWKRDDHFTAAKNPAYWQSGLPHPDKIVFRIIPDDQTRLAALQSGQIDLTNTGLPSQILQFRGDKSVTMAEQHPDTPGLVLLNTAVAPLDDIRVRQALSYATDAHQILATIGQNVGSVADGPYRKESPWYSPSGYPTKPNLEKARSLIKAYQKSKNASGPVKFALACTPSPTNQQLLDLVKAQWSKVGIEVSEKLTEQATFINDAIFGRFQANCWIQFGLPDPDLDSTWWLSANAGPVGSLALNMARNKDPQIDAALQEARTNPDPAARKAAYGRVWKRFAALVPYVWTTRGINALIWNHHVHVSKVTLPDGAVPATPAAAGTVSSVALWVR